MKKFLVIGNPINHSLSPKLHNYWINQNNIDADYQKMELDNNGLENLILKIKNKEISGVNVTVPFKKGIISYLDKLSPEAEGTQSVNTICLEDNNIVGYNTDIRGFELAIKDAKFNLTDKNILILGAGGVVPSIIFALNKMKVSRITLCNRTKEKAENLKNFFKNLTIVNWGEVPDFDMVINATSIGLNNEDLINLDFSEIEKGKFFYDVIYNPKETNFLKIARKLGNKTENGMKMFIHQAAEAFKIWHGIVPKINKEVSNFLDK
ncbi:MAG: shikimate dehydrogenase [Pelagibacteraceae bacterium TMED246]|nr:MAG: shikimate dehydrogenase [Pelagibacteraceae bacterium TMED246]|tara:strand:+ start:24867 stop:25661 length:795 start_codon:yes stop_codon:yes gene_type:complete